MKNYLNSIAKKFGYKLIKDRKDNFPVEATKTDRLIRSQVKPYTMTSDQRLWALLSAIKYISKKQIRGDLVECGVWKGGSAMAMALQLKEMGETGRDIWLYDTFSGMTEPSSKDVEYHSGRSASKLLSSTKKVPGNNVWCICNKEEVIRNLKSTGYPFERFHIIEGDILKTLDNNTPDRIALLRLDTDWYASTIKELEALYPKLVKGGICIIDDYGHWEGARSAVDEYFKKNDINVLMHYIDNTGRMFIKT